MTTGKSIGETLREGRLNQRLSISECAKRTHISARYLEALENERWTELPSESHRMGFLKLYSRFLGVYNEELLQVYRQAQQPSSLEKPIEVPKRARPQPARTIAWPQLTLVLVLVLASAWALYHTIRRSFPEQHMDLSWLRLRPSHTANRLVVPPKREIPVQRIRAKSDADSWLRVMDRNQLVFEGILPAGSVKEWSGPGPFQIKVGNTRAVSIYWNDQPVDVKASSRGSIAEIRLPPAEPEKTTTP